MLLCLEILQSLSLNKIGDFKPATLLKKGLWHRCFLNFAKFLRIPFYRTTLVTDSLNRRYLHCAILKALHNFQEKGALESRDMQFFLQNVPRFSKCLKTTWNSPEQSAELKNKRQRQKHHTHNFLILSLLLVIIMV